MKNANGMHSIQIYFPRGATWYNAITGKCNKLLLFPPSISYLIISSYKIFCWPAGPHSLPICIHKLTKERKKSLSCLWNPLWCMWHLAYIYYFFSISRKRQGKAKHKTWTEQNWCDKWTRMKEKWSRWIGFGGRYNKIITMMNCPCHHQSRAVEPVSYTPNATQKGLPRLTFIQFLFYEYEYIFLPDKVWLDMT